MHDGGCRTGALAHGLRAQPAGRPGERGTGTGSPSASSSPAGPRNFSPAVVLFFGRTIRPSATHTSLKRPPATVRRQPNCARPSALKATTDATGGGAAGSVYMELILTNSGTGFLPPQGFRRCLADQRPQRPADRGAGAARHVGRPSSDVLLAPGKSGTAVLRYTQAGNYPDCVRAPAAGFRVYPPEDTASLFVATAVGCLQQRLHRAPEHRGIPGPLSSAPHRLTVPAQSLFRSRIHKYTCGLLRVLGGSTGPARDCPADWARPKAG